MFINTSIQISLKITFRHCNEEILSQEVTSQGDPLAMLMYSIGIPLLIKTLNSQDCIQTRYVDGSSCIEKIEHVKNSWKFIHRIIINY